MGVGAGVVEVTLFTYRSKPGIGTVCPFWAFIRD
jgi:hypothetical protein